jgi:hypothetical protein
VSDTVTKKELAEVLRAVFLAVPISEGSAMFRMIANAKGEADRLDPPKVEPEWPKLRSVGGFGSDGGIFVGNELCGVRVEIYPAGIVRPVVEALRYSGTRVSEKALAAFDAACKGKGC